MKIILCDINPSLIEAWKAETKNITDIEVIYSDFRVIKADAIVSPANCFVIMDGGVDLPIREYLGSWVQESIKEEARQKFGLPIVPLFSSVSIPLQKGVNYKYLISTPTMEVPKYIANTPNAYICTLSSLKEAENIGVDSVLLFGMGGLTGGYSPLLCAKQMVKAIKDFRNGTIPDVSNWEEQIKCFETWD